MPADLTSRLVDLNVCQRGSERAPNKPLLVLLALGALSRGQVSLSFQDTEAQLRDLLREFGPPRKVLHPEYAFWRLQSDGVWMVSADSPTPQLATGTEPGIAVLRAAGARGSFTDDVRHTLLASPGKIAEVASAVLEANFPETLHQDILDAVGLASETAVIVPRRRDPNFRGAVLVAYQYRCALCGLDLRIGSLTVGLEAAHIKWHQARGPDTVDNGFALCSLHHKLFDFGAFTVGPDHHVLVSEHVNGSGEVDAVLLRHHGGVLRVPRRPEELPNPEFLDWHAREVFKERALPRAATSEAT